MPYRYDEYPGPFAAYKNYVVDLAGAIGGRYGLASSLADGVYVAVAAQPATRRVARRPLRPAAEAAVHRHLRLAWTRLAAMRREVADGELFDETATTLLPIEAYAAVTHAAHAYAVASHQAVPHRPAATRRLLAKEVGRGLFPYPWDATCDGCPQLGTHAFDGIEEDRPVLSWTKPDPGSSRGRYAMFLRTTRQKELERRFAIERRARVRPGRTRAVLPRAEKERIAETLVPTTLFDALWRMRVRAGEGAFAVASEASGRAFGDALVIVADATCAALEGAMAAYGGRELLAEVAESHVRKTGDEHVRHRAAAWRRLAALPFPPPLAAPAWR